MRRRWRMNFDKWHCAARRLYFRRHLRALHLCARRHRPRAGLHLYVPWPRIQGAMLDHEASGRLSRRARRTARPAQKRSDVGGRGDCIDCKACVAVCPMGIDIRNGAQLECIQCALCIDACDDIMDKVGRPRGLIAYTTERNMATATTGPRDGLRLFARARSSTLSQSRLWRSWSGQC